MVNAGTMIIDKLKINDKNPRLIKEVAFKKLKKSLREFPQMLDIRPIVYDESGVVLGGNMRIRALKELEKEGMEIKDSWFVKVSELTEEQKKEFIIKDNVPFGEWDTEMLANEWSDLPLEDWGIDTSGWKEETEEDEAPEVDETSEPISKLGEVYQLGRHRLMCGDSTKIEDVEKLMNGQKADMVFTDAPYGVSYGDKNSFLNAIDKGNRIQENIDNDTKTVKEMKELWVSAYQNMNVFTKAGGSYYCCSPQGGELMMMMMISLLEAGWELKQTIIWAKNNHVLGRSDYHYKHEPLLYGWKSGAGHKFYGGTGETTVWNHNKPLKSDLHPTMKPIELIAHAINNSSKQEDIVLDLFGGSGSTLIACEQLNRTCYMMEIDPKYVDVIRKRYAKFIGKEEEWQTL